jgi:hypothetical protein
MRKKALPEELEPIEYRLEAIENLLKKEVKVSPIQDPIYTTEKVMSLLSISRRTLQSWRDEGKLTFSVIGNKFYYRLSAIEALLSSHLQQAF